MTRRGHPVTIYVSDPDLWVRFKKLHPESASAALMDLVRRHVAAQERKRSR